MREFKYCDKRGFWFCGVEFFWFIANLFGFIEIFICFGNDDRTEPDQAH